MKKWVFAAFLFAALMGGAGCGVSVSKSMSSNMGLPKSSTLAISWSTDGNPLVPVCGTATQNCKSNITVLDETTGVAVSLPITATSYTASNPNDTYDVRVNGFDGEGNSISSQYEQVPIQ
jgi:hypothetical protein